MKRTTILWMVLAAWSSIPAAGCSAYVLADLPAGWGIDPNQIQGTILSARSGTPAASDPNTWLMEIGDFVRVGNTNGWVAGLGWVSTNTSDSLVLHTDPDRGYSTTWELDGWIRPGPNYKVIDAWSWPTWGLFVPRSRYTVVVVGVTPPGTEPGLE
jgi:hypothetical protein